MGLASIPRKSPPNNAKPLSFKGLSAPSGFAKNPPSGYNISYFKESFETLPKSTGKPLITLYISRRPEVFGV
jgi:hypothetical protein